MKKRNGTWMPARAGAIVLLAILLAAWPVMAQTLSLMAPTIANVDGELTVRFGVSVVELPILKGELEDGAKLVLTCRVALDEVNDYWPDDEIAETSFESALAFDPITKEFSMTLPGKRGKISNPKLAPLLKEGWSVIETVMGPWTLLEHGEHYRLSLRTTMHEADAPEGLTRYIYFWSWDVGPDSTFLLNFTF